MVMVKFCGITSPFEAQTAAKLGVHAVGLVFAESRRKVTLDKAREITNVLPPFISVGGVFVNEPIEEILAIAAYSKLDFIQLHGEESKAYLLELKRQLSSDNFNNYQEPQFSFKPTAKPLTWHEKTAAHQIKNRNFIKDIKIIKAFQVTNASSSAKEYSRVLISSGFDVCDAFLLDAYDKNHYGGTGKIINWELFNAINHGYQQNAKRAKPIILAGGLTPANIYSALSATRPWGIDVSSGIEANGVVAQEKSKRGSRKDLSKMRAFMKNIWRWRIDEDN